MLAHLSIFMSNIIGEGAISMTELFLGTFGNISKLIQVITYLSIGLILIFFAKSIFDNYFRRADNQYAPTLIENTKKLLIAFVVA
jgi:hypothetical protein